MKIIVRVPNWVGDSVLAWPVLESLKQNFPQADLWVAAKDWVKDLFASNPFVEGVIALSGDWKKTWDQAAGIRGGAFDTGLLLTNSFASALLFYLARIPQRWGYATDGRGPLLTRALRPRNEDPPRHQARYYMDLLAGLGFKPGPGLIRLSVRPEEKEAARRRLLTLGLEPRKPLVILSPGASYGPAKRWPARRFAELAELLQKRKNAELLIIGAADEAGIADSISSFLEKKPAVLAGQTTLPELLGLATLAALFISNDSGPMHLANALGVPVVGIFGPTDPAVTGPAQQPARVIKKDVPCWPCFYRKCPYDHRCMMDIAAEDVFRAAEELWP
jgi:heptosyltransferase-2